MSLGERAGAEAQGRFPRVSGDEPPAVENYLTLPAFSPRERG